MKLDFEDNTMEMQKENSLIGMQKFPEANNDYLVKEQLLLDWFDQATFSDDEDQESSVNKSFVVKIKNSKRDAVNSEKVGWIVYLFGWGTKKRFCGVVVK